VGGGLRPPWLPVAYAAGRRYVLQLGCERVSGLSRRGQFLLQFRNAFAVLVELGARAPVQLLLDALVLHRQSLVLVPQFQVPPRVLVANLAHRQTLDADMVYRYTLAVDGDCVKNEKKRSERRKHRAGWRKHWRQSRPVEPKNFAPPQTPFPGAQDGRNLISWRWSLPLPTNRVW